MKATLFLFLLAAWLMPLHAENWTTTDGKTYQNVRVLSHDAAYVTILHEDGGGRIPLSTLPAALQKRFDYDPAKAAAEIAAQKIADKKNEEALAREKEQARLAAEQGDSAMDAAVAQASLPPPPADASAPGTPSPADVAGSEVPPVGLTEIDDYGPYGGDGYYGGYGIYGFGYGAYSHGYRGGFGYHTGMPGFTGRYGSPSRGSAVHSVSAGAGSGLPAGHH